MNEMLGWFEHVILLAIARMEPNAYGTSITGELERCIGREVTPGALYTSLERLEKKAMVRSALGEPTAQRGGRAKRYYTLTDRARAALLATHRVFDKLLEGVSL